MMNIIEITGENWEQYKVEMLNLENKVKNDMIKQGIDNLKQDFSERILYYGRKLFTICKA